MKKIIFYLMITAFTFAMTSCDSFLTEDPKGRLTTDVLFKDANGLDMAVTGMYSQFRESWRYVKTQMHVWCGDDVTAKNIANKARFAEFDRFYYNSLNVEMIEIWRFHYNSIKAANSIIDNAESMTLDRSFLEPRIGQAYIIRAYHYFNLVRIFGRVPLVTHVEVDYTTPLATIEDIYALIEADLVKAEAYLPIKHTVAPYFNNGINIAPGKGAAKAMLASVWMTQAGWPLKKGTAFYDKAAAKFKEIIDNESTYGYNLEPDIWTLTKHPNGNFIKEIVWGGFMNQNNGFAAAYCELPEESGGWGDVLPEIDFYNKFPDGPRKDAYFLTKVFIGSGANGVCYDWWNSATREFHPYFKKNLWREQWTSYNAKTDEYTASGFGDHGKTRYLFRYADILLLYAEAVAYGSGTINDFVVQCVKRVQDRAGIADNLKVTSGMSREAFQKAVLLERKWETCGFEMSVMGRFFTMQRHEILHLQGPDRIWDPKDPTRTAIYIEGQMPANPIYDTGLNPNVTLSEEYYYLPIPALELQIVPDLLDRK